MMPTEVTALLAYAAAVDPRVRRSTPQERQLQEAAWFQQLQSVAAQAAKDAVDMHYAKAGVEVVMPGDVRVLARGNQAPYYKPLADSIAALPAAEERTDGSALGWGRGQLQVAMDALAERWNANGMQQVGSESRTPFKAHRPARSGGSPLAGPRGVTVCHRCVVDIPVPDGWDPANPASPPLHCEPCAQVMGK